MYLIIITKKLWFKGPINPDVTTLADNTILKDIEAKEKYGLNETPRFFEKTTNEVIIAFYFLYFKLFTFCTTSTYLSSLLCNKM